RWTRFKVILFVANIVLSCYSLLALVFTLLTYFHTLENARILLVANTSKLALSTLTAALALFVSIIGYPGILLNNRSFLAVYAAFSLLVIPGYLTYKRRTLNLEAKVNQQWSQALGAAGRLTLQFVLGCCGYFSPFVEATVSATCYSRSILPGCKQQFLEFQKKALTRWYIVSFGLVPVHIAIMAAGLLCSNHVTYRFGKGMMPKAYRLSREAMTVIMEQYARYVGFSLLLFFLFFLLFTSFLRRVFVLGDARRLPLRRSRPPFFSLLSFLPSFTLFSFVSFLPFRPSPTAVRRVRSLRPLRYSRRLLCFKRRERTRRCGGRRRWLVVGWLAS
ncbi:hypothetical protein B0H16DRAFT_1342982, partial [Mycena metata]